MVWYILDNNYNVIKTTDAAVWSEFFKTKKRFLFYNETKKYQVSTVFLGIDYNYYDDIVEPLVFESMVFDENGNDLDLTRYPSYKEAKKGHIELCHKYGIYYINPNREPAIKDISDLINDEQ